MQMAESVYECVLALEELVRKQPALPQSPDDSEAAQKVEQWCVSYLPVLMLGQCNSANDGLLTLIRHKDYAINTARLWSELCVTEPLGVK